MKGNSHSWWDRGILSENSHNFYGSLSQIKRAGPYFMQSCLAASIPAQRWAVLTANSLPHTTHIPTAAFVACTALRDQTVVKPWLLQQKEAAPLQAESLACKFQWGHFIRHGSLQIISNYLTQRLESTQQICFLTSVPFSWHENIISVTFVMQICLQHFGTFLFFCLWYLAFGLHQVILSHIRSVEDGHILVWSGGSTLH